jgi:hypothetical protein
MRPRSSRERVLAIVRLVWVMFFVALIWTASAFLKIWAKCYVFKTTLAADNYESLTFDGLLTVLALVVVIICTCVLFANRKKSPITISL